MNPLDILILAAGKGTRMKSARPKVLHRLAGRPLLQHVLGTATQLQPRSVVVITGHGAIEVEADCVAPTRATADFDPLLSLQFARQVPQLGTGHAVQQAVPFLAGDGTVLVLSGDVPLTQPETLRALVAASQAAPHHHDGGALALLTVEMADPTGYGRIVRQGSGEVGEVQGIVEHKDASEEQRAITEVYSGIMAVSAHLLTGWLARLNNHNAQGEYYLTDIVAMAVQDGVPVVGHCIADALQVAGINSPLQLAQLERAYQLRQAHALMEQGTRLADPSRFDVRDDVRSGVRGVLWCAGDVEIDVGCIFTGQVRLGKGVQIGAHCCIANVQIAAGAIIHPYTHIDGEKSGASVGEGTLIGPFARLRPGAQLGREVHIGNFVEVKNSTLADGAKANHLAYLGDATVGRRVNYGAGSITANYDGAHKHRTVIEDDVHIGSNCVLVAPITIGAGGTVGGGSTLTKNTAPGALSVSRGKVVSVPEWKRPTKSPDTPPGIKVRVLDTAILDIAVLGIGMMGLPIAQRLCAAGHRVHVWNRTRVKAEPLTAVGARVYDHPTDAVCHANIVISLLENGPVVEEVLFAQCTALAMQEGSLWIEMASTQPREAREHAARLAHRGVGIAHLDAPVSGGTVGAENGTLAIMVGGDSADYQRAKAIWSILGRATHVGPHGAGQLAKLANQMIVGVTIGAVAEALLLASKGGADMAKVREAIGGGFAESRILQLHGQRMIDRDFAPRGRMEVQLKDMRNALATAAEMGFDAPITALFESLYAEGIAHGGNGLDHSGLFVELARRNGMR